MLWDCILCNRIWSCSLSNALEKSTHASCTYLDLSRSESAGKSKSWRMASVVPTLGRYEYWLDAIASSIGPFSLLTIACSANLPGCYRRDIGMKSLYVERFFTLVIGVICACFHKSGYWPSINILFIMSWRGMQTSSLPSFEIQVGKSSADVALVVSRLLSKHLTFPMLSCWSGGELPDASHQVEACHTDANHQMASGDHYVTHLMAEPYYPALT